MKRFEHGVCTKLVAPAEGKLRPRRWEREAERRADNTEHRGSASIQGGPCVEEQNPGARKTWDPKRRRWRRCEGFYVKKALLSPGPSPRGSPRGARATQLQPPGDQGSRGDGRAPQRSPSPAHPGQRHLHRGGGGGVGGRIGVRVRGAGRTRRQAPQR